MGRSLGCRGGLSGITGMSETTNNHASYRSPRREKRAVQRYETSVSGQRRLDAQVSGIFLAVIHTPSSGIADKHIATPPSTWAPQGLLNHLIISQNFHQNYPQKKR